MPHRSPVRRLREERGFTLIELLIVLFIIGVLIAISISAYIGFRQRASDNAAKANLRTALPSAENYYADNETYAGMTGAELRTLNAGISPTLVVVSATATAYCLSDAVGGRTWSVGGPGADTSDFVPNGNCS